MVKRRSDEIDGEEVSRKETRQITKRGKSGPSPKGNASIASTSSPIPVKRKRDQVNDELAQEEPVLKRRRSESESDVTAAVAEADITTSSPVVVVSSDTDTNAATGLDTTVTDGGDEEDAETEDEHAKAKRRAAKGKGRAVFEDDVHTEHALRHEMEVLRAQIISQRTEMLELRQEAAEFSKVRLYPFISH